MIPTSFIDELILQFDQGLRSLFAHDTASDQPYPAQDLDHGSLSQKQQHHAAGLMRINHTGEICAQALYQGQALTARDIENKQILLTCAQEELDHLAWCEARIQELGSHTSYLNPFWYLGSFLIGVSAGIAGDKWNLGFIKETEDQVVRHLQSHLDQLPKDDERSRAIVTKMQSDEEQHARTAELSGAAELPGIIKEMMTVNAKVMTTMTYYI